MLKDIFRGFWYWLMTSFWIASAVALGVFIPSLSGFSVIPIFLLMITVILLALMEMNVIGEALRKEAKDDEVSEV